MLYNPEWKIEVDNDVVKILRSAKSIISDPAHWTCGAYARDSRSPIGSDCPGAISFCSIGALARASATSPKEVEDDSVAYTYLELAAKEQGYGRPHHLNDKGGHAQAMAMFDRAIELAAAPQ